ncbi:hypothetical protein VTN00DRAFT_6654 [Thermoascus crustaceus]|uniref:uncharacterized protein n=1 Tax=Thermoascus crustaceus TaxID=5088 RepID=UPI0037429207
MPSECTQLVPAPPTPAASPPVERERAREGRSQGRRVIVRAYAISKTDTVPGHVYDRQDQGPSSASRRQKRRQRQRRLRFGRSTVYPAAVFEADSENGAADIDADVPAKHSRFRRCRTAVGRWEKLSHLLVVLFFLFVALTIVSVMLLAHYL